MQKFTRSLFAVGAVLGLAACGDDVSVTPPTPPPASTVSGVTVVPASITIATGEKVILTASVTTTQGTGSPATTVTWTSANAAIASVSASGEVTGVSVGTTTVRATSTADAGKVGAAAVTVRSPAVRSVTVTPSALALQIGQSATAVATVDRDAGSLAGVTWTSNAPAVATVDSLGKIVAVSAGTAVITATAKGDITKAAALAVTVSAVPNNLTALTVAPTNAGLGIGGTVQLVANATTVGSPTVTYTYSSSNTAVATVNATGLVTAVGNGTAIITTTATTNTNSLSASTTIGVASASVSISTITQSGLGSPVDISNVFGQIEVTMNISAGNQTLDSVEVRLGGVAAASQVFTINGAPNAPVTLSINTARYTINADSTASVSFLNGVTGVQARLFAQGATGPTASNTVTLTLNNVDTFHQRWSLPTNSATASNGFLWYGGSTILNVIPVIYTGNTVTSVTFGLANCSTPNVTDTAAPFVATFACTATQNTNVTPVVTASLFAAGNPGPTAPNFANQAQVVALRIDNVGPSGSFMLTGVAPNNWIGGPTVLSSNWYQYVTGVTDAGVGATDSTNYIFEYEDRAVTGAVWVVNAANPSNVPENAVDFTNSAYNERVTLKDKLGNATIIYLGGGAAPGVQNYGVDITAPTLDYLTATQQPLVVLPATDTLGATKILNNVDPVTAANITAINALFGVRYRDTRSGFTAGAQLRRIVRLAPSGVTCALGTGPSCTTTWDATLGSVDLTDNTYLRDTTQIYGTYGAALATGIASDSTGYYTYDTYVNDRAGNRSPTISKAIAVDILAPQVTGVGIPAVLIGGSTVAFTPTGTDDLEVIDGALSLKYPNMGGAALGDSTIYFPRTFFADIKAAFSGAPLANVIGLSGQFGASGLTLPIGFIRSISNVDADTTAPALPTTQLGRDAAKPVSVGSQLFDIKAGSLLPQPIGTSAVNADSSATLFVSILSGLVASPTTNTPATALGDSTTAIWHIFGNGTTGSAIQARARTSTVITNAPFPQVAFFRRDTANRWVYLGAVTSVPGTNPTIFDQGTNRFWTYTLTLPSGTASVATGDVIRAVGTNSSGDGLATLNCVKGTGC